MDELEQLLSLNTPSRLSERVDVMIRHMEAAGLTLDDMLADLDEIRQIVWEEKRQSSSYDAEADVLYINFAKPSVATDSELTEDDIVVRYASDKVVGLTVLHASQRVG